MMDEQQERLEARLRQIPPAAVPAHLMARLRAAKIEAQPVGQLEARRTFRWSDWFAGWRGLAVAAPAAAIFLFVWLGLRPAATPGHLEPADSPGIKVNAVHVDHSLLASFDTVAQLPGGEPVRFRCRKWQDDVVIHDDAQGIVISQSTPRLEVVPVRFETY